jgi:hypothetical protein
MGLADCEMRISKKHSVSRHTCANIPIRNPRSEMDSLCARRQQKQTKPQPPTPIRFSPQALQTKSKTQQPRTRDIF